MAAAVVTATTKIATLKLTATREPIAGAVRVVGTVSGKDEWTRRASTVLTELNAATPQFFRSRFANLGQ